MFSSISYLWPVNYGNNSSVQEDPAIEIDDSTGNEYVWVELKEKEKLQEWFGVTHSDTLAAYQEKYQQACDNLREFNNQHTEIGNKQNDLVQCFENQMNAFVAKYSAEEADMTEFFHDLKSLGKTLLTMITQNVQLDEKSDSLLTNCDKLLDFIDKSELELSPSGVIQDFMSALPVVDGIVQESVQEIEIDGKRVRAKVKQAPLSVVVDLMKQMHKASLPMSRPLDFSPMPYLA